MRSSSISEFIQQRIDANDFPSAAYLVAEKERVVFQDSLGYAVVVPEQIEAAVDTMYDLASLTKPLATGLLLLKLLECSEVNLDTQVRSILKLDPLDDITVRDLLTHTSGLQPWLPLYILTDNVINVLNVIAASLRNRNKEQVVYSDLNFILLMYVAEAILKKGFQQTVNEEIIAPLSLVRTMFNPSPDLRSYIAASEKGNEYEKQTCVEMGYIVPDDIGSRSNFRNRQIWGEVHDGNAWFMGGVAGHAGLFSTAEEVFKIALQFLPNYTTVLKPITCTQFRTNFTRGMNEDRSLAFQLASTEGSTAGGLMSAESFGHNGFTGTSVWIDPTRERIFILLTNRTHAHRLPFININSVRRRFHDLAIAELDALS
jgi:CubicO group peptidase (beta-lactamase class C family)